MQEELSTNNASSLLKKAKSNRVNEASMESFDGEFEYEFSYDDDKDKLDPNSLLTLGSIRGSDPVVLEHLEGRKVTQVMVRRGKAILRFG